jgi:glycerol uptake facilitator-like aquaporin
MMTRKLAAEALGTAMLLMAVVGSGIMAERLAGGNDALALLANTIATVATLITAILIFGPISGAHFNPAVTITVGRPSDQPLWGYVPVQIVSGIAGVMLVNWMFGLPPVFWSEKARTGLPQWVSEGVATFALVLTILAVSRTRPAATPFAVGLIITGAYWFTPSTSFANPAVTIARAFSNTFAGIAPPDVPGFVLAQMAGAGLASCTYRLLYPQELSPQKEERK